MDGPLGPIGKAAIAAGIAAGNINTALPADKREMMDLSDAAKRGQEQHQQMLIVLEVKRRARFYPAPTDSEEVKQKLRDVGEPITLFGEGPADRRDRLKFFLAKREVDQQIVEQGVAAVTAAVSGEARAAQASAAAAQALAAPGHAATTEKAELFYTPGSPALAEARKVIAEYSFRSSQARLAAHTAAAASTTAQKAEDEHALQVCRTLRRMRPCLSQVADERPLSTCALSGDGALLAVGSWGGVVRLWNPATGLQYAALKGHRERIVGIAWHPDGGLHDSGNGLVATASADSTARLWTVPTDQIRSAQRLQPGQPTGLADVAARTRRRKAGAADDDMGVSTSAALSEDEAVGVRSQLEKLQGVGVQESIVLAGHAQRLSTVAFHPSGDYVGTTSYDKTWRLWDVRTGQTAAEILLQEGHAKEVYPLAFHPDGSLVATGDLSGLGRVWDLRSGKSIFMLKGHTKQLLALDWSPNGTALASGSDDNSSCVWDLRQQRMLYTLPAHQSLISRVKWAPVTGEYLLTASYDGTIKAWSGRDFSPLGTLSGHEGKVTGLDIYRGAPNGRDASVRAKGEDWPLGQSGAVPDEMHVVSVGFDRTFKLWAHEIEF